MVKVKRVPPPGQLHKSPQSTSKTRAAQHIPSTVHCLDNDHDTVRQRTTAGTERRGEQAAGGGQPRSRSRHSKCASGRTKTQQGKRSVREVSMTSNNGRWSCSCPVLEWDGVLLGYCRSVTGKQIGLVDRDGKDGACGWRRPVVWDVTGDLTAPQRLESDKRFDSEKRRLGMSSESLMEREPVKATGGRAAAGRNRSLRRKLGTGQSVFQLGLGDKDECVPWFGRRRRVSGGTGTGWWS